MSIRLLPGCCLLTLRTWFEVRKTVCFLRDVGWHNEIAPFGSSFAIQILIALPSIATKVSEATFILIFRSKYPIHRRQNRSDGFPSVMILQKFAISLPMCLPLLHLCAETLLSSYGINKFKHWLGGAKRLEKNSLNYAETSHLRG